MSVEVYVTESVVRKAAASGTNYLTVTVLDNGRETKYNTNAAFTKTIHYLHVSNNSTMTFFGQTFDKSTIKSIIFVDNNNVPSDAVGSMDVSAEGNGSIMAWYYKASDYSDESKLYDFYIGSSNGIVYANPNSSYGFFTLTNVTSLDLTYFDTSNVTDMSHFFQDCKKITSLDLSNFDTSNVTNMFHMLSNCMSLESINLTNINTSKVTTMQNMFQNCWNLLKLDLSNFDTSNVTNMTYMFYQCYAIESINLSSFNTSKVANMSSMFQNCVKLDKLNIKKFDFTNVTNNTNFLLNVPTNAEITVGSTSAKEWLNTNFSSYTNIIIDHD